MKAASIGVFDSGMGGLTVLRALKKTLPNESFIYLGDTARLPYGTKSMNTVRQYAVQMARLLVERKVKALIIACNTATTAALSHLRGLLPNIPVLGVVEPGALMASAVSYNKNIAILATETTIASRAYHNAIIQQLPNAFVSGRACSVLVALAEEGLVDNNVAREAAIHYLTHLQDEDTIVLGCTHFPVFKPLLASLLPKHIQIVDSAHATAEALHKVLIEKQLLNSEGLGQTRYLVTDSIERFYKVGQIFLGEVLDRHTIELVDAYPA